MEVQDSALDVRLRRMGVAFGAAFGAGFVAGLTLILLMIVPFLVLPTDPKLIMSPVVLLVTLPVMSILTSMAIVRVIERGGSRLMGVGGAMGAASGAVSMIACGVAVAWLGITDPSFNAFSWGMFGLFICAAAAISGIPIGVFMAAVLNRLSESPGRKPRWVLVLGLLLGFPLGAMAPEFILIVGYVIGLLLGPF